MRTNPKNETETDGDRMFWVIQDVTENESIIRVIVETLKENRGMEASTLGTVGDG